MVQRKLIMFEEEVNTPPIKEEVNTTPKKEEEVKVTLRRTKYRPKEQRMNKFEKYIWKNLLG